MENCYGGEPRDCKPSPPPFSDRQPQSASPGLAAVAGISRQEPRVEPRMAPAPGVLPRRLAKVGVCRGVGSGGDSAIRFRGPGDYPCAHPIRNLALATTQRTPSSFGEVCVCAFCAHQSLRVGGAKFATDLRHITTKTQPLRRPPGQSPRAGNLPTILTQTPE